MSKVEFNLLPDVKQAYIKSQKLRKLVTVVSFGVGGFAAAVFLLLVILTSVIQKQQLSSADKSIAASTQTLNKTKGIADALVVRNQLQTLAGLHQNKHISSRLFTYLPQLTPSAVTITKLDMDYSTNIMTFAGTATNHAQVNSFIDNLKAATYRIGSGGTTHAAFSDVVESSFGISSGNTSYSLTMQFDPQLFSNNLKDGTGKTVAPVLVVKANG